MKFNVYIKALTAFFITTLVFIIAFFKYMKSVEIEIAVNSQKTITLGILNNLENQLVKMPRSSWDKILNKKENGGIHLLPSEGLILPSNQMKKLSEGQIVFIIGRELQFLNLVFARKTAYKKVRNRPYVLAYDFSVPEEIISYYMTPGLQQIVGTLSSRDQKTWPQELENLKKEYGYPIQAYNNKDMPAHILNTLKSKPLAFKTKPNSSQIDIIYYPFRTGVLKIGPLKYLSLTTRISDVIGYFVLSFFFLGFFLILFISLLFVRNMKKIYQITEKFSQGVFTYHDKIRSTSVLYGLYSNIMKMGGRIKELIDSHKQMCRFVAHEIRTPLSTIQMTTDSIKRKNKEDALLTKKINSIQEDVSGINRIVGVFLIYSKMQSSEIKLRKSKVDLVSWLKNLLEPFSTSEFDIAFNSGGSSAVFVEIDPDILKHAVANLITNAMKFAESDICVTLSLNDEHVFIHVDDDGPGLPHDHIDDLFSEYMTVGNAVVGEKHIGLGLAIVKKAVDLHKGKVMAVQSPQLKGARFTIVLSKNL